MWIMSKVIILMTKVKFFLPSILFLQEFWDHVLKEFGHSFQENWVWSRWSNDSFFYKEDGLSHIWVYTYVWKLAQKKVIKSL